jgi:hypothetical protein
MSQRIGRNALCPCQSGLKFKRCCGRNPPPRFQPGMGMTDADAQRLFAAGRAATPHGQLVPSVVHKGRRFRFVGHQVYWRPPTQTFHEFLLDIVKETVGKRWYMGQVGLPTDERHQILRWFRSHAQRSRSVVGNELYRDGEAWGAAPTGDELALATLGYDLILRHHGALPQSIVGRLTSHREFQGARYEIAIAATFVRAGLKVQFIEDMTAKHAEFVATDEATGVAIEVETKSRHRSGVLHQPGVIDETRALRGDVEDLVNEGFAQASGGRPFMLFVDVNVPPVPGIPFHERAWFQDVWASMQAMGEPSAARPDEFNGLFFTSFPFHWEGSDIATLASPLSVISQAPRHPLPDEVVGRVVRSIQEYGKIPREV